MSSLPASMKRIVSKATEKRWRHRFPHYKSMGPFYCHGNQSFDPICPKTLCSLFPTPVMLHIKFDQDWPTGFRDIQVWKCGRRRTTTTTDGGPLVYYKLTLWAFGSGELKMALSPSKHSDQPGHLPGLISLRCPHEESLGPYSYPLIPQWRLWSDWADAQANLSSLGAQSFWWFWHETAQIKLLMS